MVGLPGTLVGSPIPASSTGTKTSGNEALRQALHKNLSAEPLNDRPCEPTLAPAVVDAILLQAGTTGKPQVWFTRKEVEEAVRLAVTHHIAAEKAANQGCDKGPWTAGTNKKDNRVFVASDDFTHDVRLYVDGDFGSKDEKLQYAQVLAQSLRPF